jgi:hypothetical protein
VSAFQSGVRIDSVETNVNSVMRWTVRMECVSEKRTASRVDVTLASQEKDVRIRKVLLEVQDVSHNFIKATRTTQTILV